MNIVSRKTIKNFYEIYTDSKSSLVSWAAEAQKANWKTPADIKLRYPSASFLKNNRVVFNLKGNHYRLIVAVSYNYGAIYIKFIGSHNEYNLIDAETVGD